LDEGVLDPLYNLLTHEKKMFIVETCWAVSNIMAGDTPQIQAVFDHKNGALLDKLFEIARESTDFDVNFQVSFSH